jgi:hypothetical protein
MSAYSTRLLLTLSNLTSVEEETRDLVGQVLQEARRESGRDRDEVPTPRGNACHDLPVRDGTGRGSKGNGAPPDRPSV